MARAAERNPRDGHRTRIRQARWPRPSARRRTRTVASAGERRRPDELGSAPSARDHDRGGSALVPRLGAREGQPHRRAHRLQRRARPADRDPVRDPARSRCGRSGRSHSSPRATGERRPSPPTEAARELGDGRDTRRRWPPSSPTPAGPRSASTGAIASDLPPRAGLSSSAALEVALALALCTVADFELEPLELALALPARGAAGRGRSVRHPRPGGVPARIATERAILLDCDALEHRRIHVPADAGLLIVDSGVARSLENTAYAERRGELEHALRLVGAARSTEVETGALDGLDDVPKRRLRHVVTENERVSRFAAALEAGDLAGGRRAAPREPREPARRLRGLDPGARPARRAGDRCRRSRRAPARRWVRRLGARPRAARSGWRTSARAIAARYRERAGTGGDALLVRASPGATPQPDPASGSRRAPRGARTYENR